MRTHRLIDAFGPDEVEIMVAAFDQAWAELVFRLDGDVEDEARTMLARAVLRAAEHGPMDAAALCQAGIRRLYHVFPGLA
jgi:hypothetical protein